MYARRDFKDVRVRMTRHSFSFSKKKLVSRFHAIFFNFFFFRSVRARRAYAYTILHCAKPAQFSLTNRNQDEISRVPVSMCTASIFVSLRAYARSLINHPHSRCAAAVADHLNDFDPENEQIMRSINLRGYISAPSAQCNAFVCLGGGRIVIKSTFGY